MASLPGFAEIVHQYQNLVYSVAYHSLGNRAMAEELTQDVFLSLHQNLHQLESLEHVKHWLRRTAAHRCIDEVRRQKFRKGPGLDEVPEPASRDRWQDPLLSRQLEECLASLPATARVVTILRYQEEMEPASRDRWQDPLLSRQLEECLASLPATARVVTILRYQEEMEPAEIAESLQLPVATVKSRLHRALGMLRVKMQRKESACQISRPS